MTALEIEGADGWRQKMIVRRPGMGSLKRNAKAAEDEFKLLQLAHALGLAVPRPYYLDQSGTLLATSYLVIEYIEGQLDFTPAHLADFLIQFATHLARIHSIDGSVLDVSFLPQQAPGCAETSGLRLAKRNTLLDERQIRQIVAAARPLPQRNRPVLLHGDFWPGNVLWQDGRLTVVIDWEDAKSGDPLSDLAISRLDILCLFGIEAMHTFTRHYQSLMPFDYTGLPYWDLCAALRFARLAGADLAAWAAFFVPFGRPDITEQSLRQHFQFFIRQALAELVI